MKLATLRSEHPDGRLVVVSRDLATMADATAIAANLRTAVEAWDDVAPALQALHTELHAGRHAQPFDPALCAAPLPRAPQWCDGSAFLNHGRLMEKAFDIEPAPDAQTVPLMYQGASDDFLGPQADVLLPSEADGIDFEGEFGAIVGPVPMAATPAQALGAVRLLVQINDWSLRALGPREMRSGFGFLQAKPSSSFAPIALTPDELGEAWRDGRVHLRLQVRWNGEHFGAPHGGEMDFGFGELIAHAARTRRLSAGTVIGSGTVSNTDRAAGSACIAERRVLEILEHGAPRTAFMRFGDSVQMQAQCERTGDTPFGRIAQRVLQWQP
ncbi:fumarylacetoacetate hydrolase family protein [Comamonas endophytica]|uniref:Fumarylacetoacetate hydrolase family protein n=1 Tax=Comamonas endophytica TaxID=2949090 RepID=A0ABY6GD60_9BURK|nr:MULTISPECIES: fumarylacetoacetate hydrolase family protein [unclassified Acidovorax]MCD2513757.1 fumarylacetoacetate hydrolase family protein [Acidovorax sp. D4N7]UYG52240.1 fumarylacetoacetate hydrolase family protein [Acidovorax sp. 5MLIR]